MSILDKNLPDSLSSYKTVISSLYDQLSTYIHYKAPDEFDAGGNLIPKPETLSTIIDTFQKTNNARITNRILKKQKYNKIKNQNIEALQNFTKYAEQTYFYGSGKPETYDYIRKSDLNGLKKDLKYKKNIVFMTQLYRKRFANSTSLYPITNYIGTNITGYYNTYLYNEQDQEDPIAFEALTNYPPSCYVKGHIETPGKISGYTTNFYNQDAITSCISLIPKFTYMVSTTGIVYQPIQPTNSEIISEMRDVNIYNPLPTNYTENNTLTGKMYKLMNQTFNTLNNMFFDNLSSTFYRKAKRKKNSSTNNTTYKNFRDKCIAYNNYLTGYYNSNWMDLINYAITQKPYEQTYDLIPDENTLWRNQILTIYTNYVTNYYPPEKAGIMKNITRPGYYGKLHEIVNYGQLFLHTFINDD